jgi:hypothetical protein
MISAISKQTKTSFQLSLLTYECHRGVPNDSWGMIHLAQTCTNLAPILRPSPADQNMIWYDPCHLGAPSSASKMIFETWYVRRKPCTYIALKLALSSNRWKRAYTWASSPRSTIGYVQNDPEPMVCLVQTVHLSCTDTNTISKWTEMRFDMTQVT